jgi:hypothetical protein
MPGSRSARFEHIPLAQGNGSLRVGLECAARRLAAVAATLALCIALARIAHVEDARAAALDPRGEDWEGLSDLVRTAQAEIGAERVLVRDALDVGDLRSNDSVILVHPQGRVLAEELSAFMRSGGRVILLDDYGSGDELLGHFHIRRVPLPAHPAEMLRHNPAFALASPASPHAAVRDVDRVVTNHATGLSDTGLLPLLVVHGSNEPDALLGVAGVVGRGRFVAIGDASVLMNAMLRFPGNHALARAVVRYAGEDEDPEEATSGGSDTRGSPSSASSGTLSPRASGRVFLIANRAKITGHFTDDDSGPFGDFRRAVKQALGELRHGLPPLAAYVAALLVGASVVIWASRRAGRTHKPSAPRFVRQVPIVEQGGVAGHAATLAADAGSLTRVAQELKSALEEQIAVRLDKEGPAPGSPVSTGTLVANVEARGWLGKTDAAALARVLAELGRVSPQRFFGGRRRARLRALAAQGKALLEAIDAGRHGKLVRPT